MIYVLIYSIGWILSKYIVDHSFLNTSPLWTEIGFVLISGSLLNSEMGCFISGFLLAIPLNICTLKWHNIQIATGKSFWNILFKKILSVTCNWYLGFNFYTIHYIIIYFIYISHHTQWLLLVRYLTRYVGPRKVWVMFSEFKDCYVYDRDKLYTHYLKR